MERLPPAEQMSCVDYGLEYASESDGLHESERHRRMNHQDYIKVDEL